MDQLINTTLILSLFITLGVIFVGGLFVVPVFEIADAKPLDCFTIANTGMTVCPGTDEKPSGVPPQPQGGQPSGVPPQ